MTAALGLALAAAGTAHGGGIVGTTFPAGFPDVLDASLGVPVIGFGDSGPITRTPVLFLHGNGGTPYPTNCEVLAPNIRAMAQYFADNGYATSELWALGYQGTQCDLVNQPSNLSGVAHTVSANVMDLRKFVKALAAYTGARTVDIVAHGMGVVLVRELVRQDNGGAYVRRFVAIEGANNGMNICAAVPGNSWALAFSGGYTPSSPVCQELGSPNTAFLTQLNKTDRIITADKILVIRNGDTSVLYRPGTDGLLAQGAPAAIDSFGNPYDFSLSPVMAGAKEIVRSATIDLNDGNADTRPAYEFDAINWTAHVGIANDPATWRSALQFFLAPDPTTTQTKRKK